MIHERRASEKKLRGKKERGRKREKEGRRVRMGDRDRLQHLTGCPGEPLKVTERERNTYGRKREAR